MLDFEKIHAILEKELGTKTYRLRIIHIATILDRLGMDKEEGAEELVASEVVRVIFGKTSNNRFVKKKDMLDAYYVESLDRIKEDNREDKIHAESIQDFVNVGSTDLAHNERRTLKSKIDQIKEIEEKVKHGEKLNQIKVGKQNANEWLSDVRGKLNVGDSAFVKEKISKIREKNKKNHKKGTAIDLIRKTIAKNELIAIKEKRMTSKEVLEKHGMESNGSTRKMVSRLVLSL